MPVITPLEIKKVLKENDIYLTKKRGQNFLADKNILKKIIAYSKNNSCKNVLEIGFGLGALTYYLAQEGYNVFTVEIDKKLYNITKNELKHFKNIKFLMEIF